MTKVLGAIIFGAIFVFSVFSIINFEKTYAEESGYKMAENVEAKFSFIFRDAVEMHSFPVFKMTSDFVSNDGTTFAIEGVIGNSPYLHKALDEAYKNRVMTSTGASAFEHDFRFFDVDVDLMRDGETIRVLHYYNCEILDYEALTLESGDYESYHSAKSGFSVVDKVEFRCGGINGESPKDAVYQNIDYGEIYSFAEDVRTFITFEHDDGIEKVEFTAFKLNSGFEESDDSVPASFSVEGAVNHYSLLYKAMDKARKVSGLGTAYNNDFNALVEFSMGKKPLDHLILRSAVYLEQ